MEFIWKRRVKQMSKRLNMSNDEAVEWLLSLKNLDICGENRKTAIDKAIQALEAQPNSNEFFNFDAPMVKKSDAVSRQAVLNGLANIAKAKAKSDAQKALMGRVMFFTEQLPSVTPKYTDEEIDKIQELEQAYVDKMVELAVEETKRPKGKWIEVEVRNVYATLKCSVCGRVIEPIFDFRKYSYEEIKRLYPYCHCGAEMSGGGEE
jgi:hypothetical protein